MIDPFKTVFKYMTHFIAEHVLNLHEQNIFFLEPKKNVHKKGSLQNRDPKNNNKLTQMIVNKHCSIKIRAFKFCFF